MLFFLKKKSLLFLFLKKKNQFFSCEPKENEPETGGGEEVTAFNAVIIFYPVFFLISEQ